MAYMKHFHAHIYFEPNCIESARTCSEKADSSGLFTFVKIHEKPVGPHTIGMIEVHFSDQVYPTALGWLEVNRGAFSVLVHQDTGNDLEDHTNGARWLGEVVPLDFGFFELIKVKPGLRIHRPK